jgi:hypothetical protein
MKELEIFKEHFKDYTPNYVLIGGTACSILMDEVGLDFRATKDFDMILIIENMSEQFATVFWDFIKKGNYEGIEQGEEFKNFYRFKKPKTPGYPVMIELFSKSALEGIAHEEYTITPIHISDEISSLSAIILDEEYYKALMDGAQESMGVSVLSSAYLIIFKARAWLDLKQRKESGMRIDQKDIEKHRKDILKLHSILEPDEIVEVSEKIKEDMDEFLLKLIEEDKDIKGLGLDYTLEEIAKDLNNTYQIKVLSN